MEETRGSSRTDNASLSVVSSSPYSAKLSPCSPGSSRSKTASKASEPSHLVVRALVVDSETRGVRQRHAARTNGDDDPAYQRERGDSSELAVASSGTALSVSILAREGRVVL